MQDKLHNKMRNEKLRFQLDFATEIGSPRPIIPPTLDTPREATLTANSVYDNFFKEYETAKLNIREQYDFIGRIRNEIPLIDRDEIDSWFLSELAKQLEISIFPACKMLHVEPKAVKRMIDEQFRKAYGLEVEQEIDAGMAPAITDEGVGGDDVDLGVEGASPAAQAMPKNVCSKAKTTKKTEAAAPAEEPPKKKVKRVSVKRSQKQAEVIKDVAPVPPKKSVRMKVEPASLGDVWVQVATYRVKRKKQKKGCRVVTLRSKAAAEKWEKLDEDA